MPLKGGSELKNEKTTTNLFQNFNYLYTFHVLDKTHKKDKECLVQLYLLKHLMTSHGGISTNHQHLNTLVNIACKYFDEENGSLALDALYSLLAKSDLCHRKLDLKVWFAFVNADKIEKVCKLITETIIDLFNNKESELDNLRKEIEKLDRSRLDTGSAHRGFK